MTSDLLIWNGKEYPMFLFLFSIIISCGDEKLNYKCNCTRIAYSVGESEEDIDTSFSENICDSYENIQTAFDINGSIYTALEECRNDLSKQTDDFECECDCTYQSEC
jgi:hypothetical protein